MMFASLLNIAESLVIQNRNLSLKIVGNLGLQRSNKTGQGHLAILKLTPFLKLFDILDP